MLCFVCYVLVVVVPGLLFDVVRCCSLFVVGCMLLVVCCLLFLSIVSGCLFVGC